MNEFSLPELFKSHNAKAFGQYFPFLLRSYVMGTRMLAAIFMKNLFLKSLSVLSQYNFANVSLICLKCSKFDFHLISLALPLHFSVLLFHTYTVAAE